MNTRTLIVKGQCSFDPYGSNKFKGEPSMQKGEYDANEKSYTLKLDFEGKITGEKETVIIRKPNLLNDNQVNVQPHIVLPNLNTTEVYTVDLYKKYFALIDDKGHEEAEELDKLRAYVLNPTTTDLDEIFIGFVSKPPVSAEPAEWSSMPVTNGGDDGNNDSNIHYGNIYSDNIYDDNYIRVEPLSYFVEDFAIPVNKFVIKNIGGNESVEQVANAGKAFSNLLDKVSEATTVAEAKGAARTAEIFNHKYLQDAMANIF